MFKKELLYLLFLIICLILGSGCASFMSTATKISRTPDGISITSPKDIAFDNFLYFHDSNSGIFFVMITGYASEANIKALELQKKAMDNIVSEVAKGVTKGVISATVP